jgi:hypothetical protein
MGIVEKYPINSSKEICGTSRPGGTKKATHWWTPESGNMIKEMEEISFTRNSGDL